MVFVQNQLLHETTNGVATAVAVTIPNVGKAIDNIFLILFSQYLPPFSQKNDRLQKIMLQKKSSII